MKKIAFFIGPIGMLLSTVGLLGASALHAGEAGASEPVRPVSSARKSHLKGSGVHVEATVSSVSSDTVRVSLQLSGVSAADGAEIHYSLTGPGQITAQEQDRLLPGQVAYRLVTVRLATGEDHYLNVFTHQNNRSAVTSIALDKGQVQKKMAPVPPTTQDGAGRPIVVLPGQLRH